MTDLNTRPSTSALDELRRAATKVAVPHHEPPSVVRRRRIVVAVVLVFGAVVLGLSMKRHPGESTFYWLTAGLSALWAVGAFASGPLHLGGICWRGRNQRPVITGATIGLVLGGVFVVGGLIAREIPPVAELTTRVLHFADQGSWRLVLAIALLGAIAEELFYRGALYTALGRHHPALISTVLYVAATMASQNLMLGFAAIVLGSVCAWERRATGGVLAPILTHFVWSLVVILALPPLFGL
ncbi:CPBP family intramembrane glutamic endopeptidase [Mycobacterium noviomagense]|uniref:CAAX protease family protein n=1 Tax=Mycobacterium noviomagense TaxID=459858 RepID=A0A7I7P9H9_9MYCO|nr:CPBP family intramembrane glutamic endopeptidase [Mycobacterium noviomagense]ORB18159.1 CAAX protease family protein [Mycobacterium noviomagense]BBY05246.1 CAAX protease family protein [Mycobacterium noviomagense]